MIDLEKDLRTALADPAHTLTLAPDRRPPPCRFFPDRPGVDGGAPGRSGGGQRPWLATAAAAAAAASGSR
jgi:hypothetical protein